MSHTPESQNALKEVFSLFGVKMWNCENIIKTKLSWSAVLVCTYIRVWHPSDSSGFRMIQVFHGTGQWKGNLGHSLNVLRKKTRICIYQNCLKLALRAPFCGQGKDGVGERVTQKCD